MPERWLAVEVSGADSRVHDREYKRDAYLAVGVGEVWLVDLQERSIGVFRSGGAQPAPHQTLLIWRSPESGHELRIDVPALFRDLPRE